LLNHRAKADRIKVTTRKYEVSLKRM
jgi:hypothetical protein